MQIQIKRFFGPIRRFVEIQKDIYACAVATPGFTKDALRVQITHNGLCMVDGEIDIYENTTRVYKSLIHEAIHLPISVKTETLQWNTKNGITIVTCRTDSSPASPILPFSIEQKIEYPFGKDLKN